MGEHGDPLRVGLQVGLYIFFFVLFLWLFALSGLASLIGLWAGSALGTFMSAVFTNVVTLRIYEGRQLSDIGFHWNPASKWNLAWGLAGGIAGALMALSGPLLVGAASMQADPGEAHWRTFVFITVILILGATGEEILFRGYGFQVLLRNTGPFTAILPVGVLFGAMHSSNPYVSNMGLVNTAGFGMLFGYAFWRSRDLWLPFGLHFGWNFTLPFFGTSLSGVRIGVTGYQLQWKTGILWSGGDYGPEASIETSIVLLALFVFLWKAPIRAQPNLLLDKPVDETDVPPHDRSPDAGAGGSSGPSPQR
jgi:membrane protease YdiL (CAAX protease family)